MDQLQCNELVRKTFQTGYDKQRFQKFISELLNRAELRYATEREYVPPKAFDKYIQNFHSFGLYTDPQGKRVLILSVKLIRGTSRDRARVMQRNFAAEVLRGKVSISNGANAAIIAYYGDEPDDWRLSFVKLDSQIVCGEKGLCVEETLSSAKRYSFLVGVHEPSHTCMKRFSPLIQRLDAYPTLEELEEVFAVGKVTDEFFDEYKKRFDELVHALKSICESDEKVRDEFSRLDIEPEDFAKKLLGQIVFLYFLQKKGWMGVAEDQQWGTGPRDFMKKLFCKEIVPYENFFDDILEPLFYEALAKRRDGDYYSRFGVRIPFLNGGLFEPLRGYNWVETHIRIENAIFEKIILGTFDQYNFTIKEDEPLEREVAVDPEMLGKVFEKLLNESDRGEKGAFYTPRAIVHYICQESLLRYLEKHTTIPHDDLDLFIRKGDEMYAATLQEKYERNGKQIRDAKSLPQSIQEHAKELDHLLKEIKVADPAIGSGAFPVGMMNEIVRARNTLTVCFDPDHEEEEDRSTYMMKREAIENSLYGVDIDPSAVDIAKLRFWLSLIVDEDKSESVIRPLPNLDQKIMVGNSLVEKYAGIDLFDETILTAEADPRIDQIQCYDEEIQRLKGEIESIPWGMDPQRYKLLNDQISTLKEKKEKLQADDSQKDIVVTLDSKQIEFQRKTIRGMKRYRQLQQQFFNEQDSFKKKELRDELSKQEWDIIERVAEMAGTSSSLGELKELWAKSGRPFFLWKLYYSEVFSRENPGFDCIIGNPPYVQLQSMDKMEREKLQGEKYSTYAATGDLYCLFYEKGYHLLRNDGVLGFITSNSWMLGKYGKKLRGLFATLANPLILIDSGKIQIFGDATVAGNILIIGKNKNQGHTLSCTLQNNDCIDYLSDYVQQNGCVCEYKTEENWVIMTPIEKQIQMKIEEVGTPLRDWDIQINFGIKTGFNEAFIIDTATRDRLIQEDSRSAEVIRPILRGRDIERYGCKSSQVNNWLIATFPSKHYDIDQYPAIRDYLLSFGKRRLEQSGEEFVSNGTKIKARKKTNNKWFETQDSINYWEDFSKQKIVWGEISDRAKFMIDESGEYFTEATAFILTGYPHLKYLLSVLNSKVSEYAFGKIGTTTGMGTIRWKKYKILDFRIPQISISQQMQFEDIVDEIIKNRKLGQNTEKLERKIDEMLYDIFGFGPDEIRYIEGI